MSVNHVIEISALRSALKFYANDDNYWSGPLSLQGNWDRRTLKAVKVSEKANKILVDRGEIARKVLTDFEKSYESQMR